MRKPVIAANWKMYKTPAESLSFIEEFLPLVEHKTGAEVAIFPTMTSLDKVIGAVKGSHVTAGAQNMHWEIEGAFTGSTSPKMLKSLGCTRVLIGHSERRTYAHETDEMVNRKLRSAVEYELHPMVCVGETLEKRERGLTEAVLAWQIACALNGMSAEECEALTIAYEPVWAIGTGVTASPEQAQDAHQVIRREVARYMGEGFANKVRILYGGSVKPGNVAELMAKPDIDGALVGGASLEAKSFAEIVTRALSA